MRTEYELRFFHISKELVELIKRQATLVHERQFMRRYVFSIPHFAYPWYCLRVRDEGSTVIVAFKQNNGLKNIDSVQEQEMPVFDFDNACAFFESLGYKKEYYLESYRTTWTLKNCMITYDELPGLDPYIEIEGHNSHDVLAVAQLLGLMTEAGVPPSKVAISQLYKQAYALTEEQVHSIKKFCFSTIEHIIKNIKNFKK